MSTIKILLSSDICFFNKIATNQFEIKSKTAQNQWKIAEEKKHTKNDPNMLNRVLFKGKSAAQITEQLFYWILFIYFLFVHWILFFFLIT